MDPFGLIAGPTRERPARQATIRDARRTRARARVCYITRGAKVRVKARAGLSLGKGLGRFIHVCAGCLRLSKDVPTGCDRLRLLIVGPGTSPQHSDP